MVEWLVKAQQQLSLQQRLIDQQQQQISAQQQEIEKLGSDSHVVEILQTVRNLSIIMVNKMPNSPDMIFHFF